MEGAAMSTKPAIRITAGDVPAPTTRIDVALFGGHMDGLQVTKVEIPGTWPVITTLEEWVRKDQDEDTKSFMPRRYSICLCTGKVALDRKRRVRYCLEES